MQANQALDSYLNHGYQLALNGNDDLDGARTVFKAAKYHAVNGVQNYMVNLTHTWQDVKEDRTIVRTINYHLPDGTVKTVVQSVTISRQAIGTKVYGQWSQDVWQAVQVPERAGYSPSQAIIATETVDGTSVDKTVDVYYHGREQTASVRIVDLTADKPLTEEKLQGLSGEPINFAEINAELTAYLAAGYILTPDNQDIDDLAMKPADFDSDDQSDQLFMVYLTHRIDEVPESKPVTRVIEYHQPDGTIKTVRETKPCQRILKIDAVTGQEVASSDWEVIDWPDIVPPIIKGFAATVSQNIPQTADTFLVEVSYQAEPTNGQSHNQAADRQNRQNPGQLDQSGSNSADFATVSSNLTDKPAAISVKPVTSQTNNQRLVQTGNQATGKQTVLDTLLLGLAGMLSGLGLKKKKRGDR